MDFVRFIEHGEWLFFTKEYDIVNMIILFKNFLVGYGVFMCLINWYIILWYVIRGFQACCIFTSKIKSGSPSWLAWYLVCEGMVDVSESFRFSWCEMPVDVFKTLSCYTNCWKLNYQLKDVVYPVMLGELRSQGWCISYYINEKLRNPRILNITG